MNKTGWIIFVAIIGAIIGGLIAWTRISNPPLDFSNIDAYNVLEASPESGNIADRAKGSTDNKVVLIEYGDFQCSACSTYNSHISTLMNEYGNKVTLIFRNYPLTTIHPNALAAAAAAEAAGQQGKYWEMHDLLYESQSSWSNLDSTRRTEAFNSYAQSLGINMDTFKNDVSSPAVTKKISFDQSIGRKLGVNATPTFYLNDEELDAQTSSDVSKGELGSIKAKIDALYKK